MIRPLSAHIRTIITSLEHWKEKKERAYYASYSSLTSDQESIYTPSSHAVDTNQRYYFNFSLSSHHPTFVPDDSPPLPPNQYEVYYQPELSRYQLMALQSHILKEEKVQERMILGEKMRYYQSEVEEFTTLADPATIPAILRPDKNATKLLRN